MKFFICNLMLFSFWSGNFVWWLQTLGVPETSSLPLGVHDDTGHLPPPPPPPGCMDLLSVPVKGLHPPHGDAFHAGSGWVRGWPAKLPPKGSGAAPQGRVATTESVHRLPPVAPEAAESGQGLGGGWVGSSESGGGDQAARILSQGGGWK